MLTTGVKRFIETYVNLIEASDWEGLYNQAYKWLTNSMISEVTTTIESALKIDLSDSINKVLRDHIKTELIRATKYGLFDSYTGVIHFYNLYMNSYLGLDWDEYVQLVATVIDKSSDLNLKTMESGNGDLLIKRNDVWNHK